MARQNIPLFKMLLPACVFYSFANACFTWLFDHASYSLGVIAAIMGTGMLAVFLSRWEISLRQFAMILFASGKSSTVADSLSAAQKMRILTLAVAIPIIFADLFISSLLVLATWLLSEGQRGGGDAATLAGTFLGLVSMGLVAPFFVLALLNAFFMAIIVLEKKSVIAATGRFFSLLTQAPLYCLGFFLLAGLVLFFVVEVAPSIIGFIPALFSQWKGPAHDAVMLLGLVVESLLLAPLYAYSYACFTFAGACLYKQLTMTLEGADLICDIEAIRKNKV